jgi:error-prone DNA polymerase
MEYVELHAASAFSFLRGSSMPEDLMQQAAELGLPAVALTDVNGVYGAPRFYQEAKKAGVRALVGAEMVLDEREPVVPGGPGRRGPLGLVPEPRPEKPAADEALPGSGPRVTVLVESRTGYKNLCKMLTAAALGRPKGEARVSWDLIAEHSAGLHCLTGGDEGPVARALADPAAGVDAARRILERLTVWFGGRLHVELQRHRLRDEEHRNRALLDLAQKLRLPVVATNGVRYARREDKSLHDVLTAIRHHTTLDAAGSLLAAHRERHLKTGAEMKKLFADLPLPRIPAAARRNARLLPAPHHLERRQGPLPAADRQGPGADPERAGPD